MNRPTLAGLAALALAVNGADEPFPRFAPKEPAEALATFQVQGGFRLDLLAAEPLVMDPVAAAYDEDGRLYVVEMSDYPHVDAGERQAVRREPRRPADRPRPAADRPRRRRRLRREPRSSPTSSPGRPASPSGRGACSSPRRPTSGTSRTPTATTGPTSGGEVFTGFRKFNVQAVMNNLQWGLDHTIYGAGSSNGGKVRRAGRAGRRRRSTSLRRDFRFDPVAEHVRGDLRRRPVRQHVRRLGQPVPLRHPQPGRSTSSCPPATWRATPTCRPPARCTTRPRRATRSRSSGSARPSPGASCARGAGRPSARRCPRSELVGAGYLTSSSGLTVYRGDAYPRAVPRQPLPRRGRQQPDPPDGRRARRRDLPRPRGPTRRPSSSPRPTTGSGRSTSSTPPTARCTSSTCTARRSSTPGRSPTTSAPGSTSGAARTAAGSTAWPRPGFRRRPTPRLGQAGTAELVAPARAPQRLAPRDRPPAALRAAGPGRRRRRSEATAPRGQGPARAAARPLVARRARRPGRRRPRRGPGRRRRRTSASTPSCWPSPGSAASPALRAAVVAPGRRPGVRVRFQVAFTLGEVAGDDGDAGPRGDRPARRGRPLGPDGRPQLGDGRPGRPLRTALARPRLRRERRGRDPAPPAGAGGRGARTGRTRSAACSRRSPRAARTRRTSTWRSAWATASPGAAGGSRTCEPSLPRPPPPPGSTASSPRAAAVAADATAPPDRRARAVALLGQGDFEPARGDPCPACSTRTSRPRSRPPPCGPCGLRPARGRRPLARALEGLHARAPGRGRRAPARPPRLDRPAARRGAGRDRPRRPDPADPAGPAPEATATRRSATGPRPCSAARRPARAPRRSPGTSRPSSGPATPSGARSSSTASAWPATSWASGGTRSARTSPGSAAGRPRRSW